MAGVLDDEDDDMVCAASCKYLPLYTSHNALIADRQDLDILFYSV